MPALEFAKLFILDLTELFILFKAIGAKIDSGYFSWSSLTGTTLWVYGYSSSSSSAISNNFSVWFDNKSDTCLYR